MGLSQSSEVPEGGTYGYHVHSVRLRKRVTFETGAAAYHETLLSANRQLAERLNLVRWQYLPVTPVTREEQPFTCCICKK